MTIPVLVMRFGSHGRRDHGAPNTAHRRRRRLVWLQHRLQEATATDDDDLSDQQQGMNESDVDGDDLSEQIVGRQIHEAMMLGLVARALGVDMETILACLQDEARGGGGFGAVVPACAAAVAGLEKQTFHASAAMATGGCGGGGTECAICFEDFEDGEEVSVMPCSPRRHEFHGKCITKWLGRSNTCPLCRHELPTGSVDG